jgi:O-antigen/teichoic acid export membrane protein
MSMSQKEQPEPVTESSLTLGPEFLRHAWIIRGRRILGVVTGFLLGQGASQALTLLAGLFLVRHLSVTSYAQFGLASGFQAMFLTLMDLGFAGTIVPLVGDKRDDRALVGRYVRSAKHLRDLSFLVIAPIASLCFLGIMHRQHWGWGLQATLLGSVLLTLYAGGKASYFAAPLILHGRLRPYYVLQVTAAAIRLGSYVLLAYTSWLSTGIAVGIAALTTVLTAEYYAHLSKPLMDWPEKNDRETARKIIRYVLPATPASIFAAFQAQITLMLISLLGGQVEYIAQVAAIGRIGQVFTVLVTFNLMVVEPFVARLQHRRLLPTFSAITGLACLAMTPLVFIAFRWPQTFLLLIGPKYRTLSNLLGWVILAASVNYVAGLIWMMNRARKWIFWSGSILEVVLLIGVQAAFVAIIGVKNTRNAVFLTLAASFCPLISHVYVSILGFWKNWHHRDIDTSPSPAAY